MQAKIRTDGTNSDIIAMPHDLSMSDMIYLLEHPEALREFAKRCVVITNVGWSEIGEKP